MANFGNDTLTTYTANGTATSPTVSAGLDGPVGVAVDAKGKIYVANETGNSLTAYDKTGVTKLIRRSLPACVRLTTWAGLTMTAGRST